MKNKHFLKLLDFGAEEIHSLLDLAKQLKKARKDGREVQTLQGKVIALIFEKDSTRTRCSFEVGALHQGGHSTYLGPGGSHIGGKESIADSARVLGAMFDAIQYRGHSQAIVEELARFAGVPVYNGLTDEFHPTQILADFLTMMECCPKPLKEQSLVYLGDGANNMGNSLMVGCAKLGLDFRMASPSSLRPAEELIATCRELAQESGGKLAFFDDPKEAVRGADFLYTDVWLSMGQPKSELEERIKLLKPYRVDAELMRASANPETQFLHCLPAFHNSQTPLGADFKKEHGLDGMEVSDHVFESPQSVVFRQSENRLHTIKAVMVATLAD